MSNFLKQLELENKEDNQDIKGGIVYLSIDEINNLSIDDLLTYRKDETKIKLNTSSIASSSFDIRWNKDGLDVSEDRHKFINDSIKALHLKLDIENKSNRLSSNSLKDIKEIGKEINNKDILQKILGLNLSKESKEGKEEGFGDVFNLINKVSNNSNHLNSIGGKVNYITEKLQITDLTEVIYIILLLSALEDNE